MLNKIIRFSVKNKLVIGIFMLLWVIYGTYEVTQLPIDAVPDITNNQVQVITTAPSLGAEDVERLITFPIEQAISNIPGLKESRSMSRFGLSLITIVFDDASDVYWARQQVTERLSQVEITEDANTPQLAPATTGLGEIYQYVLKPKDGFEKKYSLADLRTTQDWIVRRQLLGTPGVADVSTFGGELKQYEVAVIPANLKALNLSISDVFTALSRNNQNTGGAYIEKGPTVMYIRSVGLAGSMDDIRKIVVKNNSNGAPVLISHVAEVRLGSAIRYGALTMAGKGELSGGIVMMLKGGNSSEVIKNVKLRVAEIQKTLPEGMEIEPFLDRTKMVDNAIGTVEHNLLEGALIVVLILVLFLGNLRAGLIVASVIPLSMLFAITMMNFFGVSGNLMSLGALDFGLIVDGAVIIVEAILHHMHFSKKYVNVERVSQAEMDEEVTGSASRMMNAAVFGQIIILIVYLPILSLSGIEGKMFKPMAQTVAFAVMGAFILSLTYIPMISALLISKKIVHKPNFSDRMMTRLENGYARLLTGALRIKKTLVISAFALFGFAVFLFMQMGGEFIPQLEEGDFATETRLLVGTNLSTTIDAFKVISEKLKADYPEVEKIVSRIGSAEIPTDPMPIEGGDMIIVLKDKSEWKSAKTFPDLASKMAATAQEVMPGVTTGFQYPVQMRFNELMTGAKQDVVCKIFGEDLDKLAAYAEQLGSISKTVDGTADWYIEKVTGMPQVVIEFNRDEIAKYGMNIDDVNRTINAAFAGAAAGQIYEGEKKFDLVVRVGNEGRRNINDVQNLLITTPGGIQIPLYQVASIQEVEGPNQIQRENTRRRIIVGFNVRGRDVQSIVEELQGKVDAKMKFEAGYSITYGGAFENLQQAKARLIIAVPIALLLIFIMLYFAFSSVKDGLLIYTAIPLSAIGGVFGLALRGMPFSISAGVGFIALFGVAVLNGIVLLSEFNRIRKEGVIQDALQVVMTGTRNRLRPVLMTAAVASLGFLPMALSNGAGAEVQRPLATVVIGGLISATLLTLFVLPGLYLLFDKKVKIKGLQPVLILLLMLFGHSSFSQTAQTPIDLDSAVKIALEKNLQAKSDRLGEKASERLQSSSFDIAKTNISADYGKVNSINNDNRIGISQTFNFPSVYANQRKLLEENFLASRANTRLTEQEIRANVRQLFFEYISLTERKRLLTYADSVYRLFETKSNLRFEKGAANVLEKTAAESRRQQITNQLNLINNDLEIAVRQFNFFVQDSKTYIPKADQPKINDPLIASDSAAIRELPLMELARHQKDAAQYRWQTEKSKLLPDITVGYNNQTLIGPQMVGGQELTYGAGKRFGYVSAGIGIPLFFKAQNARVAAAKLDWERNQNQSDLIGLKVRNDLDNASQQIRKYQQSLQYYEGQGLKNANVIIATADQQFQEGDIDFLQWAIVADQAITIKNEYINALNSYNLAVIDWLKLNNL
ncbi:CusA/CzcA family heavy metal efflux RND transporter [Dyadobacter fanqingshengii]|uniref:CusA/CzcA family heavy metal efflux RND transporter n=1 Tax=Dyadobacter fanqingshengii TaxID=2906443 RepID=A0A9X1P8U5_9BACT|nr:CusA/CzcA family heavy metal efflux RND transporter [Dyadobacter fanqingshengii]MCF0040511.1 CusA/CzcA family heavy metal efflux RND transporter [Dyadobacter fanqingshengii]USJ37748.1 CusA/CzcA family heavy metal efflux RND transporter [Dyadobacter fanqingshengii]